MRFALFQGGLAFDRFLVVEQLYCREKAWKCASLVVLELYLDLYNFTYCTIQPGEDIKSFLSITKLWIIVHADLITRYSKSDTPTLSNICQFDWIFSLKPFTYKQMHYISKVNKIPYAATNSLCQQLSCKTNFKCIYSSWLTSHTASVVTFCGWIRVNQSSSLFRLLKRTLGKLWIEVRIIVMKHMLTR